LATKTPHTMIAANIYLMMRQCLLVRNQSRQLWNKNYDETELKRRSQLIIHVSI